MSIFQFDSLGYSERLQEAGVPQAQAAVHAKVMAEVLAESVAFPNDLVKLENMVTHKIETAQWKLATEIEKIRSDTTLLKYMVGIVITLQISVFFKLFFS